MSATIQVIKKPVLRLNPIDDVVIATRPLQPGAKVADEDLVCVDAVPPGVALTSFRQQAVRSVRRVDEGDIIDLGDRTFEVLHLPGHSPGGIGLWEARTRTLFSGDVIYDGPLLDDIPGANVADYVRSMRRLRELPVEVVHGGHDPSFGRARLLEIVDAYLAARG